MNVIDPRIAVRRHQVEEGHARARIRRVIFVLGAAATLGSLGWVLASPLLAVEVVELTGARHSAAAAILEQAGVTTGRPILLVRPGRVEKALRDDPWVADAEVTVDLPGRVVVGIEERVPAVWVPVAEGWALVGSGAVVLATAGQPDARAPSILVPGLTQSEVVEDPIVLGSMEFLTALPDTLTAGIELWMAAGELWAEVAGYQVRLGPPFDLGAKAGAVGALIAAGQPEGSILTVVAPTHPAVMPPTTSTTPPPAHP